MPGPGRRGGAPFRLSQSYDDLAPGLHTAVRWQIRDVAAVGLVVEWSRFRYAEATANEGVTVEGAREYTSVGGGFRRYTGPRGTGPRGFVGASVGVAIERFSRVDACAGPVPTEYPPCEETARERGGWFGGEAGVSLPVGAGLLVEASATVSGVAVDWYLGRDGPAPSDVVTWVGLRVAIAGPLW